MENKRNVAEDESISYSFDELSTDDKSDDRSISMNDLEDVWYGNYVHIEINKRDFRLKICERIRQTQSEWTVVELLANSMGKVLHKVVKAVVTELNNSFPTLGESGS